MLVFLAEASKFSAERNNYTNESAKRQTWKRKKVKRNIKNIQ
jgi:hypothetical protein